MRLCAVNEAAGKTGLKRGQPLAEARAMISGLHVEPENPDADRALLAAIADWCERYTPLVAIDGDDGLFLDISGCAHLFGGEAALLLELLQRLRQMGLDARGAVSDSAGLSWGVCRFASGGVIGSGVMGSGVIRSGDTGAALARLPVAALRVEAGTSAALAKLGLKRVGDLMALSRAALARRFGTVLLARLDQALGVENEAISPRRPQPVLCAGRQFAEPIRDVEAVLHWTRQAAHSLLLQFQARGIGGRLFELVLFRVDGRVLHLAAGTSRPLRAPDRIARLFSERLAAQRDDFDAGFGFETLRLGVLEQADFVTVQDDLCGGGGGDAAFADFVDRASARFGRDVLRFTRLRQSHVPERAEMPVPAQAAAAPAAEAAISLPKAERPLRLFRHPEIIEVFVALVPDGPPRRFRWRKVVHEVLRAEGPERIAPEWWHDAASASRDYFRLECGAGRRLWVFREGAGGAAARWLVHGIFP